VLVLDVPRRARNQRIPADSAAGAFAGTFAGTFLRAERSRA
jgi:hypothetical protein